MSHVQFATMTDLGYEADVLCMMEALYGEDEPASEVDRGKFPLTLHTLITEPARGRIVLFLEASTVRGYALLIPFWSNEFGGTVLLIDELFVKPEARNRGIGRGFIQFVGDARPFDAVAMMLEVSPTNTGARRLYESVGFSRRRNESYTYRFGHPVATKWISGFI